MRRGVPVGRGLRAPVRSGGANLDPNQFLDDGVNRLKLREAALGDDAMRRTIGLFKLCVRFGVSHYFVSQWRDFFTGRATKPKE